MWSTDELQTSPAARALAATRDLPLLQVDLSALVSKYIGETEKNLSDLLGAVAGHSAVLSLDGAEAVFGKRSGGRAPHARSSSAEVSLLLGRLESQSGVVVLTCKSTANLDPAFLRRVEPVVHVA